MYQRHARIAGLQARIISSVAVVMLAITALFGGVQTSQNSDAADKTATAEARAEFWQVVSGDKAPQGATSMNKLAVELREALGTPDGSATLPEAIEGFSAGPSDFPGIVDDLGIQPFNDQGMSCSDCGPLNGYIKNQLLQIKQGGVDQVVAAELAGAPKVEGLTLTPFGIPIVMWWVLVYLTTTSAALVLAIRIDSKRNDYHRVMLSWRQDNGSSADPYKMASKIMAFPHFWGIMKLDERFGKSREAILGKIELAGEYAMLNDLSKQVSVLPNGQQRDELKLVLENLRSEIDEQLANYLGIDRDFKEMEASALSDRIAATAETISQTLTARRQARLELESGFDPETDRLFREVEAQASKVNEPQGVPRREQR